MNDKDSSPNSTQIGYIKRSDQKNPGTISVTGTDHGQVAYKIECLDTNYGYIHGINGSGVHDKKCPRCPGEKQGIEF